MHSSLSVANVFASSLTLGGLQRFHTVSYVGVAAGYRIYISSNMLSVQLSPSIVIGAAQRVLVSMIFRSTLSSFARLRFSRSLSIPHSSGGGPGGGAGGNV